MVETHGLRNVDSLRLLLCLLADRHLIHFFLLSLFWYHVALNAFLFRILILGVHCGQLRFKLLLLLSVFDVLGQDFSVLINPHKSWIEIPFSDLLLVIRNVHHIRIF